MISIIIVNYHVEKELTACIASIYKSKPKTKFEIIVVDNDEEKTIKERLLKKFPKVNYIPNKNCGFGQANNVGAKKAKGEYLFVLNPDTEVFEHTIDKLIIFLSKNKQAAIVAPLLVNMKGKPYPQGTQELTPLRGVFSLSFIHQFFPNNPISKKYRLQEWNWKSQKEVGVVPGTAFVIRRTLFEKLGGFDERFFLYFEEFDLCRRIQQLGYKLFIIPEVKVAHHWGASTKRRSDIQSIFNKSRFYYFRKNFGLIKALLTEAFLRFNKYTALLMGSIFLGAFLRFYNLHDTMHFIGDQGWFYISARDFVLRGNVPLVGIPSSHPWLHQGAYWTYLLAFDFKLFGFNPYNGAYLGIVLDILGIIAIYALGKLLFSQRAGIIAALLYAVSPIVILNARTAYHTSPVPFITILTLYAIFKWIKGQTYYFPIVIFLLAVLYNFVLVSFIFSFIVLSILVYGLIKKYDWAKKVVNKKILILSLVAYVVAMLPMLIYDVFNGFPQTLKLLAWIGYRVLVFFGYTPINPIDSVSSAEMFLYITNFFSRLILPNASVFAGLIVFICLIVMSFMILKKTVTFNITLLFFMTITLLAGIYFSKTPSGAYLPMVYPGLILLIAITFDKVFGNKYARFLALFLLCLLLYSNSHFTLSQNSSTNVDEGTILRRIEVAKYIVNESKGKEYNLIGKVNNDENENFSKNYEYLTWWLGNGPSASEQTLRFIIHETGGKVKVIKKEID